MNIYIIAIHFHYCLEDQNNQKGTIGEMREQIMNILNTNIFQQRTEGTPNDVISNNAKVVLFSLFGLILASIIMYSVLITGKYNPDSSFGGIPLDGNSFSSLEQKIYNGILNDRSLTDIQKIEKLQEFNELRINGFQERFKQIEQMDSVFIAAISGAVALGGTLISQLWGRRQQ
jgi:hypothetical protein